MVPIEGDLFIVYLPREMIILWTHSGNKNYQWYYNERNSKKKPFYLLNFVMSTLCFGLYLQTIYLQYLPSLPLISWNYLKNRTLEKFKIYIVLVQKKDCFGSWFVPILNIQNRFLCSFFVFFSLKKPKLRTQERFF